MENTLIQNVKKLFEDVDLRNWPGVKAAMAQNVELDFRSLSGNAPGVESSDSIVSAWHNFLPGFDSTRHQLTDFKVTQTGDNAIVTYYGLANHYLGKDIWTVEANYESQLAKINGAWLLSKHKLNLIKQSGNTDLPMKAAEKVKSKNAGENESPGH
nr:nuclear transport factor 2 family protein [uncultured Mucilaginibacter sp.]